MTDQDNTSESGNSKRFENDKHEIPGLDYNAGFDALMAFNSQGPSIEGFENLQGFGLSEQQQINSYDEAQSFTYPSLQSNPSAFSEANTFPQTTLTQATNDDPFHTNDTLASAHPFQLTGSAVPHNAPNRGLSDVAQPLPLARLTNHAPLPLTRAEWKIQAEKAEKEGCFSKRYRGSACMSCDLCGHQTCECGKHCSTQSPVSDACDILEKHGRFIFLDPNAVSRDLEPIAAQIYPPSSITEPSEDTLDPDTQDNIQHRVRKFQIDMKIGQIALDRVAWLDPSLRRAKRVVRDDNMQNGPILQFRSLNAPMLAMSSKLSREGAEMPTRANHELRRFLATCSDTLDSDDEKYTSTGDKLQFAVKKFIGLWSLLSTLHSLNIVVSYFNLSSTASRSGRIGPEYYTSQVRQVRREVAFGLLESLLWHLNATFNQVATLMNEMASENQTLRNEGGKPTHMLRYSMWAIVHALMSTKFKWFGEHELGIHGQQENIALRQLQDRLQDAAISLQWQLRLVECRLSRLEETRPLHANYQPDFLKLKKGKDKLCLDISITARLYDGPIPTGAEGATSAQSVLDILREDYVEEDLSDMMVVDGSRNLLARRLGQAFPESLDAVHSTPRSSSHATFESTTDVLQGLEQSTDHALASHTSVTTIPYGRSLGSKRGATASSTSSSPRHSRASVKRQRPADPDPDDDAGEDSILLDAIDTTSSMAVQPTSSRVPPVNRKSWMRIIKQGAVNFVQSTRATFRDAVRHIGA